MGRVGRQQRVAMSADVVVLPFVPVIPIVGAGQSRRTRSGSDTIAGALRSPACAGGPQRDERGPEARLGRRDSRA